MPGTLVRRFTGWRGVLLRMIAVWVITAASLMLLSALLRGVAVASFGAALGAAALIGLLLSTLRVRRQAPRIRKRKTCLLYA